MPICPKPVTNQDDREGHKPCVQLPIGSLVQVHGGLQVHDDGARRAGLGHVIH